MTNPGGTPANLKPPFSKTNQPKNNGRKPSSIKKYIKENNISYADVAAMAKFMLPLNEEQIRKMLTDPKAPFLMRVFAKAVLSDLKGGHLSNVMLLIDRAVGKPKESLEIDDNREEVVLSHEEKLQRIKQLISERVNDK